MDSSFSSIPAPAKAASVLTIEIVGYAALSAGRQHAFKHALRQVLQPYKEIPPSQRPQLRDTLTGVQMVFLSSPEHTCLFALSMLRTLEGAEPLQAASLKLSDIRMGLHFGMVHQTTDMEMRTSYLGEGIKTSVQMLEAAVPGQALASPAFFDTLEYIAGGAEGLFQEFVVLTPMNGGPEKAYPLSSKTTAFTLLERIAQKMPAGNAVAESAAPAAHASDLNKNIQTVQGWLTPVNVLVTFGTFLMTLIGRFTDQARAMTTIAVVLLVFGLLLALLWLVQRTPAVRRLGVRYPQRLRALVTGSTMSLVLTASAAMALAAWVTTKDSAPLAVPALASGVPPQTSNASLPATPPDTATAASPAVPVSMPPINPESVVAATTGGPPTPSRQVPSADVPQPMPVTAISATSPESGQPPEQARPGATAKTRTRSLNGDAPLSDAASTQPRAREKAVVRQALVARRPTVSEAVTPAPARGRPERCTLILQKASLDEPISPQEKTFLSTACN